MNNSPAVNEVTVPRKKFRSLMGEAQNIRRKFFIRNRKGNKPRNTFLSLFLASSRIIEGGSSGGERSCFRLTEMYLGPIWNRLSKSQNWTSLFKQISVRITPRLLVWYVYTSYIKNQLQVMNHYSRDPRRVQPPDSDHPRIARRNPGWRSAYRTGTDRRGGGEERDPGGLSARGG